jgi:rhodanese-related sulfurtransferase
MCVHTHIIQPHGGIEMTDLITRNELQAAIADGEVTVVDALPASYFEQLHLPGAVNLFVDEAAARAASVLPDKNAAIVTYCSNEACPNSEGVARTLTRLGYTDVRKYREGIQDWVAAGLPTESGARAVA